MRTLIAAMIASAALVSAAYAQTNTRLHPNTATAEQLSAVPGLSQAKVDTILAKRPFADTGAFDASVGADLTPEQKQALYEKLFLPINLNTAPREHIMLIPGMTRRMAHEFEEYRPYTSLAQFDKEIGKYVKPDEVARLRSYVELKPR